jgi:hypothetical protein
MRLYIYALFFRYGDLLSVQQDATIVDDVFDNPLFITFHSVPQLMGVDAEEAELAEEALHRAKMLEQEEEDGGGDESAYLDEFDAYKKIGIAANRSYTINNEFLYQGEALFYHQLRRLKISGDLTRYHLEQHPEKELITINYEKHRMKRLDFIKFAMDKWCAMCASIAVDKYLRKPVIEKYTVTRVEMHLFHGERERYKRQYPESNCEANDILTAARPLVMNAINSNQKVVLADLIIAFKNEYLAGVEYQFGSILSKLPASEYEKEALEKGLDHWCTFNFEQEALLLTKLITKLFFQFHNVTEVRNMDNAFLLEELVSLERIEETVFLKRKAKLNDNGERKKGCKVWPIFLKLIRVYYVIDKESNRVFKSLFFVEAFLVWLAISERQGLLRNGEDNHKAIHSELVAPLKKLNSMLQF